MKLDEAKVVVVSEIPSHFFYNAIAVAEYVNEINMMLLFKFNN